MLFFPLISDMFPLFVVSFMR